VRILRRQLFESWGLQRRELVFQAMNSLIAFGIILAMIKTPTGFRVVVTRKRQTGLVRRADNYSGMGCTHQENKMTSNHS